jgi:hypothetical protein
MTRRSSAVPIILRMRKVSIVSPGQPPGKWRIIKSTTLNPVDGEEIEHTPCANHRRRNIEDSASNDNSDYTVTEEEWEIARAAITNNTRIPSGALAETLNAYHTILERNRV